MKLKDMVIQIIYYIEDNKEKINSVNLYELRDSIKELDIIDMDDYSLILDDDDVLYIKNLSNGNIYCINNDCAYDLENEESIKNVRQLLEISQEPVIVVADMINTLHLLNS